MTTCELVCRQKNMTTNLYLMFLASKRNSLVIVYKSSSFSAREFVASFNGGGMLVKFFFEEPEFLTCNMRTSSDRLRLRFDEIACGYGD